MPDIFLSYSRDDQAAARRYAEAFGAAGLDVWWDVGLRAGEAYDQVTEKALREARAVVVLWSKTSVDSRWVRAEATLADRNKTLIPAMIEPCERPIMFELTQTAELAHWQGDPDDAAWKAFVADVQRFVAARAQTPAAPAPPESLAAIAAEPAPAPETLIAVLPFDNVSNDPEMGYFSDGVSEDILSRLTRGSKLKVIGRTSSFQFRGADKPRAAAALKATHIVDGSIRRAGTKVRIAAHLTEASGQTTLWSERYDRDLDDIFAIQDEISEAIAAALNTTFFPPRAAPIEPAVYDLYLRVKDWMFDPANIRQHIESLEYVTRAAPEFADGWVALARRRAELMYEVPFAERQPIREQAWAETLRALKLSSNDAGALAEQWMLKNPFGDFLSQEQIVGGMLRNPNISDSGAGMSAMQRQCAGRYREAIEIARRAHYLDPGNRGVADIYGQGLWRGGRFAEGRAVMERTVLEHPGSHHTRATLALACAHDRDWAALDAWLDPAVLELHPLRELSGVKGLVAVMRDPTEANRAAIVGRIRRRVEDSGHVDATSLVFVAEFASADEAFAMLGEATLGPTGGPADYMGVNAYRPHLLFPAAYTALRADPRFVALCARLGLVEYWLETGALPDCAEVVPYDFKAECEKHRDTPKDVFFA